MHSLSYLESGLFYFKKNPLVYELIRLMLKGLFFEGLGNYSMTKIIMAFFLFQSKSSD